LTEFESVVGMIL